MNKIRLIRPWHLDPERQQLKGTWQPATHRPQEVAATANQLPVAMRGPSSCDDAAPSYWPPAQGPSA